MESSGVDHLSNDLGEEALGSQEVHTDVGQIDIVDESVAKKQCPDEQCNAGSFKEVVNQKNSAQPSVLEISQSKELSVCSSPQRG